MKKLLLATALFVGSMSMSAQNAADFNTLTTTTSYGTETTTDKWQMTNCMVKSITMNAKVYMAPTLNGKTTAVGTITSPVLKGGIGTLSFNYANLNSEKNGVELQIDIKQNDKVVKTQTLANTSVTQNQNYSFTSDDFNVEGDFTIYIENLSPSNSSKNADRVSIFNLTWTSFDQASAPKVAKPTITMVEGDYGYTIEMACETEGASIHYTVDGTEPTAESRVYNAPLNIWEKTTVKAIAVKDGEKSNVSTFEANPPMILDGFDALLGADPDMVGEGINVVVKAPMTVLYVNGNNAMVRCGMSNMLFYDRALAGVKAGDTFNRVEGTFKFYFGQPEITGIVGGLDITASAEAPSAMPAGVTEVQRNMLYSYMSLTDVAVTNIDGKNAVITDELGNSCKLYNQFNAVTLAQGGGYNITGFVGVYKEDVQFWATDIDDTNSYELIDAPTFSLPSGSTVALYSRLDISAPEGATIYISVDGGEFEADNMLYFYNMGEVEVRAYAVLDGKRSPITTATYTVGKADRGMAWINDDYEPVAEVTVVFGSEEKPVYPFLDGIYDMPVFTSSNPEVATIAEWGEITIVGLGTTTITATMDEAGMYAAGEASFVINVISEEEAKAIKTTVDFSAQSWPEGYGKDKTVTWTGSNGYTFETSVVLGDGKNTYPALRTADGVLRVYGTNGNEITVNAPANFQIKSLEIVYTDQDPIIKVGDNTITADGDEIEAQAVVTDKSKKYTFENAIDKFVITTASTGRIDMGKIHFVLAEVPTGLNAVEVAGDTEAVYYNLQGVRVANPAAGIYIRIADGKASKVVIR